MTEKGAVTHPGIRKWVDEVAAMTRPDRILVCDGSDAERDHQGDPEPRVTQAGCAEEDDEGGRAGDQATGQAHRDQPAPGGVGRRSDLAMRRVFMIGVGGRLGDGPGALQCGDCRTVMARRDHMGMRVLVVVRVGVLGVVRVLGHVRVRRGDPGAGERAWRNAGASLDSCWRTHLWHRIESCR